MFCDYCFFQSLEKYQEVELLDHMVVLVFSFWGNPHCLHHGCTNVHCHQHCMTVSFSLHPRQHFLLFVFLIIATWQVWGRTSLWSWLSNPSWNVEHLFMCCWPSVSLPWRNVYSMIGPSFKLGWGVFPNTSYESFSYFGCLPLFGYISLVHVFSQTAGCLFLLLTVSLAV